jgi:threonine synthase
VSSNQMENRAYIKSLICSSCGKSFSVDQIHTYCVDCKAPLMVDYDLKFINAILDRDRISHRPRGMWRWLELLPVTDQDNIITLGEGDTPLLRLIHMGKDLGLMNLFLKEEALNPTGSFKARGISAGVSKAKELGIKKVVIPSAGNAGGALAAYAARAGINALVYMPKKSRLSNIVECKITGATVELVDGLINTAGKYAEEKESTEGWFNMSTFKEPYRVEGKKIMGYEIAESLGWKLPDAIIYPTGGGTGLVGMWKAFRELEALGWLESKTIPKMIAVQAEGCAPIVKSIMAGKLTCDFWENAQTVATGLCVPKSFADQLILKDIRESNGTAVSVTDKDIIQWQQRLAQNEGIFSCPEGAATIAGLDKLIKQGEIRLDETVVVFNTGSGIKYICA